MNPIARLIVVAGIGLGTYSLCYWPVVIFMPSAFDEYPVFLDIAPKVLCLILAFAASWMVWRKLGSEEPGIISHVFVGAVLVGGICFAIGFFGPVILGLGGNLGPLVGILYTGPIGVVLGAISGFLYWRFRHRKDTP